ncbi:hypothetical protein J6590_059270 [Homalodisca vitripennis]|nr:hypothetical protein J6590_059270 [Homalodisca vitripennis]
MLENRDKGRSSSVIMLENRDKGRFSSVIMLENRDKGRFSSVIMLENRDKGRFSSVIIRIGWNQSYLESRFQVTKLGPGLSSSLLKTIRGAAGKLSSSYAVYTVHNKLV